MESNKQMWSEDLINNLNQVQKQLTEGPEDLRIVSIEVKEDSSFSQGSTNDQSVQITEVSVQDDQDEGEFLIKPSFTESDYNIDLKCVQESYW